MSSNNVEMTENKTLTEKAKYLLENEEELQDEISDFLSENSIEEINENIAEIKDLSKVFKRVHRQMKFAFENYEDVPKIRLEICLENITEYLANAKVAKKNRFKYSEEQRLLDQNEEWRLLKEKENAKNGKG